MNGRQRIDAALNGNWPDRTPVMLHNFMMAAREAGVTMRQFREDPRLIARCFGEAAERYQLDSIFVDIDTATLAGAIGVPVDFPEDSPARSHGSCLPSLEAVRELEPRHILRSKNTDMDRSGCNPGARLWSRNLHTRQLRSIPLLAGGVHARSRSVAHGCRSPGRR